MMLALKNFVYSLAKRIVKECICTINWRRECQLNLRLVTRQMFNRNSGNDWICSKNEATSEREPKKCCRQDSKVVEQIWKRIYAMQ